MSLRGYLLPYARALLILQDLASIEIIPASTLQQKTVYKPVDNFVSISLQAINKGRTVKEQCGFFISYIDFDVNYRK